MHSVLIQLRWTPSGAFVGSAPFGGLRYEAAWAFVVVLRLYFPLCKINWTRTVRRTRKNWYCSSCITKNAYWATVPRAVTPAELTFCYPSPLCTFLGMIVGIRVTDPRHTVLVLHEKGDFVFPYQGSCGHAVISAIADSRTRRDIWEFSATCYRLSRSCNDHMFPYLTALPVALSLKASSFRIIETNINL